MVYILQVFECDDAIVIIVVAKATAVAVYLVKNRHTMDEIHRYIHENFYPMDRTLDEIRPTYKFEVTCQKSVSESIIAFLESESYENAIRRKVISLGGDADTMGAITGGIAWTFYRFKTDEDLTEDMLKLQNMVDEFLPEDFIQTLDEFDRLY